MNFNYHLIIKRPEVVFNTLVKILSGIFVKQPDILSFSSAFEHCSHIGHIEVIASSEIKKELISEVEEIITIMELKEKDFILLGNFYPSSQTTTVQKLVHVIRVQKDTALVMQRLSELLNPWFSEGPKFESIIEKKFGSVIILTAIGSNGLNPAMVQDVRCHTTGYHLYYSEVC